jgi:hypothetical protein
MTSQPTEALELLLAEAEGAHGVYETTELGGVYDQGWPRWYATYAVEHGIGELVGRVVVPDELAALLTRGWGELDALDPRPDEPWTAWMARWLLGELD